MTRLITNPEFANWLSQFTIGFACVTAAVMLFFIMIGVIS
jgi:hypothetical protein